MSPENSTNPFRSPASQETAPGRIFPWQWPVRIAVCAVGGVVVANLVIWCFDAMSAPWEDAPGWQEVLRGAFDPMDGLAPSIGLFALGIGGCIVLDTGISGGSWVRSALIAGAAAILAVAAAGYVLIPMFGLQPQSYNDPPRYFAKGVVHFVAYGSTLTGIILILKVKR